MGNRFSRRRQECKIWEIVARNKLNDLKGEWANYFGREVWNAAFLDLVPQNYPRQGRLVQGGPSKSVKVVIKARSEVKDREEFFRATGLKCAQNGFYAKNLGFMLSAHKIRTLPDHQQELQLKPSSGQITVIYLVVSKMFISTVRCSILHPTRIPSNPSHPIHL